MFIQDIILYHIIKENVSSIRVNPLLSQYKYRDDALKAVTLPLGPIGAYLAFYVISLYYLTIRLRARVFYEQIVNEAQPSWLSLVENEGE